MSECSDELIRDFGKNVERINLHVSRLQRRGPNVACRSFGDPNLELFRLAMQRAVFLRKSGQIGYQRHQLRALGNTPAGRLSSEAHPRTQLPDFHLRRQEAVVPPSAGSIRNNRCRNAFDRDPNFACCKSGLLHDSEHRTGVQNHARRRREGLLAQILRASLRRTWDCSFAGVLSWSKKRIMGTAPIARERAVCTFAGSGAVVGSPGLAILSKLRISTSCPFSRTRKSFFVSPCTRFLYRSFTTTGTLISSVLA